MQKNIIEKNHLKFAVHIHYTYFLITQHRKFSICSSFISYRKIIKNMIILIFLIKKPIFFKMKNFHSPFFSSYHLLFFFFFKNTIYSLILAHMTIITLMDYFLMMSPLYFLKDHNFWRNLLIQFYEEENSYRLTGPILFKRTDDF